MIPHVTSNLLSYIGQVEHRVEKVLCVRLERRDNDTSISFVVIRRVKFRWELKNRSESPHFDKYLLLAIGVSIDA